MSFTVAGLLDDTMYEVEVTGRAADPVVGSKRVVALVKLEAGNYVMATPMGPRYLVDPTDPASILALLSARTFVRRVGDGAPKLVD